MKLSDIKGARSVDVIAELIDPIATIAMDEESAGMFKVEAVPDGMTAAQFTANRLKKYMPKLLKKHRDEIIHIMATVAGVDDEVYAENMTIVSVLRDINEMISDPAFVQLFR